MIPFTDYLNVSVPLDHLSDVADPLRLVFDAASFDIVTDDSGNTMYRCQSGSVRFHRRSRVVVVGASGSALRGLRAAGLFGEYLSCLAAVPHRVTRIDCTLDVPCDAAGVVEALAAKGRAGGVALSRKKVVASDVLTYLAPDDRGVITGTVYFGSHSTEVRGVVYDKRWQLLQKGVTCHDVAPCTRYEIRVSSKFGPTLHDAFAPRELFWHFASPGLLQAPSDILPWVPRAEGFTLPARVHLKPFELLSRRLDTSPEMERIVDLAAACGPMGVDLLVSRVRKLWAMRVAALEVAAATPIPTPLVDAYRARAASAEATRTADSGA